MSIDPINIGGAANDGNGQNLRSGGQIINANFAELDQRTALAQETAEGRQPTNLKLTAIAGSIWAANQLMFTTGSGTVAMTPLTVAARALLDDPDSTAMRVTLGLGGQILQALQALAMTANGLPYFASATTMAVAATTAFGRGLLGVADGAAGRAALGALGAGQESIGIGQTWREVSGRAIGTIYTNSTGRPIQVSALVSGTSGANVVPVITVGTVPIYGSYAQGANNYIPIPPVIVPPGATYRLTIGNGTATLTNWQEMSV